MKCRRSWLAAAIAALLLLPAAAQPLADEAGARAALERCVAAWNRHVPKAFADACVTDDVWFTEADDSTYRRFKGREKMLGLLDYSIRNTDLQWQIVGLQPLPDGTVGVQLKQRTGVLPRKQGKYAKTFDSDPSYARLRHDGRRWKIFFFTSHTGWARALLASPDAFPVERTSQALPATDPPVPPGTQPKAYMQPFGIYVRSCGSCHGRPPTPSQDPSLGRIVATGAAAVDAKALRREMSKPSAGADRRAPGRDPPVAARATRRPRRAPGRPHRDPQPALGARAADAPGATARRRLDTAGECRLPPGHDTERRFAMRAAADAG